MMLASQTLAARKLQISVSQDNRQELRNEIANRRALTSRISLHQRQLDSEKVTKVSSKDSRSLRFFKGALLNYNACVILNLQLCQDPT